MELITEKWVREHLPTRTPQSHKFENGYLTALVGSKSYPGAARLSSYAAARVGAGGVQLLIPQTLWPLVASFPPEIIPVLLPENKGELTHVAAFEAYIGASSKSRALLIGCGLGRTPPVIDFVKTLLSHTNLPVVIDGDALFAISIFGKGFIEQYGMGRWILTPHRGELVRLVESWGLSSKALDSMALSIMAKEFGIVLLAKGFPSVTYTPEGETFVNPTGNPAASTAGCGDVLAGMIAGYLAQGLLPADAAKVGMYVAGRAADSIVQRTGMYTLMASDIIDQLKQGLL